MTLDHCCSNNLRQSLGMDWLPVMSRVFAGLDGFDSCSSDTTLSQHLTATHVHTFYSHLTCKSGNRVYELSLSMHKHAVTPKRHRLAHIV